MLLKIASFCLLLTSIVTFSQKKSSSESLVEEYYGIARKSLHEMHYKKSLIYADKSLQLALKKNNFLLVAKSYNIIGLNYEEFSEPKKAIEFLEKGLYYAQKAKNDTLVLAFCTNIGGISVYRKVDIRKGIQFYHKAYKLAEKLQQPEQMVSSKIDLAVSYYEFKKPDIAFKMLQEIKKDISKQSFADYRMFAYTIYAKYYTYNKVDLQNAETYLTKALIETKKIEEDYLVFNIIDLYKFASDFYTKRKNFSKAYFYLKQHDILEDKIFNEKKENMLNKEFEYMKLGQVNDRILKGEYENKINQEKLKRSRVYISSLIFGIIMVVIVLFYFTKGNKKLKEANEQLYRAQKESDATVKIKNQFISTVSHELRTPLYGIIGLTDIIENENTNLKENKFFSALKYSSKHLLSLINDVLDVYKIEEGKLEFTQDTIDLEVELEAVMESLHSMAIKNNTAVNLIIAPNVPTYIVTDKTKLSQIIINLLSNAYKFTQKGSVLLKVERVENDFLSFEITDTGIGIPKTFITKIFDKFVQVDRNSSLQYQGTGLGLTIVKKIIESLGGEISIESEEGMGTKVSFTIPFQMGEIDDNEPIFISNQELNTMSVLIVEDNPINQLVTYKILEKLGLQAIIVDNGTSAIDKIKKEFFDLILMDINMSGMNGFETSKAIREFNTSIPIVALTASDKFEIAKQIKEYGINDVIVKPFDGNELITLLVKFSYYK